MELQEVLPMLLKAIVLHLSQSLLISGYPWQRRTYDTFCRDNLWLQLANDVYKLVNNCSGRCRARIQSILATPEAIICQCPSRVRGNGHIRTAVKEVKGKPICGRYDQGVFRAYTCNTCIEDHCLARCTDNLRQLVYASGYPQLSFNW